MNLGSSLVPRRFTANGENHFGKPDAAGAFAGRNAARKFVVTRGYTNPRTTTKLRHRKKGLEQFFEEVSGKANPSAMTLSSKQRF